MLFDSRFRYTNNDARVYAQAMGRVLTIVRRLEAVDRLGCLHRGWSEVEVNSIIS